MPESLLDQLERIDDIVTALGCGHPEADLAPYRDDIGEALDGLTAVAVKLGTAIGPEVVADA